MIPKRQYRVLSQEEAASLRRRGIDGHAARRLYGFLMPQAGGEETDEEKKEREERERKEREERERETPEQKAERERKEKEEQEDDDYVRVPKREAEALRRENAEMRRERKKREETERKERERRQAEEGKHAEIAEEAKRERDDAVKAKEKVELELADFKAEVVVGKVAQRLNFHDPTDAHKFLTTEQKQGDESTVERALKAVAREKTYLVAPKKPSGGGHGGGNGGGDKNLYTFEEIQRMSVSDIQANQEKVDRSMEALGRTS